MNETLTQQDVQMKTLVDIIKYRAENQGGKTAYDFMPDGQDKAINISYSGLGQRVKAIASRLEIQKISGHTALLLYSPGIEFITAFFGCLASGVIPIPAYPPFPVRPERSMPKIRAIVKNASPKICLCTFSKLAMFKYLFSGDDNLKKIQWLATDSLPDDAGKEWEYPYIDTNSTAFLQYTSGSTAVPRGVEISHNNLINGLKVIYNSFEQSENSKAVIWLPPYHDMGLIGGILQPIYGGFPVMLFSPNSFVQKPLKWLQLISDYRATTSGGPNFGYEHCLSKITPEERDLLDLSSWELAFNGAEPVNPEIVEKFTEYFAPCGFRSNSMYPCYGLAEGTLLISGGKKSAPVKIQTFDSKAIEKNIVFASFAGSVEGRKLVSCGKAVIKHEIRIVDPNTLEECDSGKIGEIWVSGPAVAKGYYNNFAESEATFNRILNGITSKKYLRTGDLGFLYEGELFITGREKDLIIINGHNHYPQDIEWSVGSCDTTVNHNSCVAFSSINEGKEELIIVCEIDPRVSRDISAEQLEVLRKKVKGVVSREHDLQVYEILFVKSRSIPRTTSGKVRRRECLSLYTQNKFV